MQLIDEWCYGIIKGKFYFIGEIYWRNKKPRFYTYISFFQFLKDFLLISKDIYLQIKNHRIIKTSEFKI